MSLEEQIKQAWKFYRHRSEDCHQIAQRVKARKVLGKDIGGFAYPEEIEKYDRYARELKEAEEYIAVRQQELNRKNPKLKQENYKFNSEQIKRLRNELS